MNGWFLGQPHTGSGQYTTHLLRELRGVDVRAAHPPSNAASNLGKLRWEQLGWPAVARNEEADLLHCPYFALPLKRNRPAVVTIHDVIPLLLPAYRGNPLVRAYSALQALACRSAEAILVDSECSRRDVIRLLKASAERVHVVYLAVDGRFTPDRGGPSPLDRPYIFYIGGWDVRKNVPALIRAFEALSASRPELVLAIAGRPGGTGPMFPDLQALAAPLGDRVRFLGRVSDEQKVDLYRHAEVFVFPSLYEGFGLDPLEALACGCPVVCSDASSLPEIVGEAGILVDARVDQALSAAICQALDDSERLREAGPRQAARFDWVRTAEQTRQVYAQALGDRGAEPRLS